MMGASTSVASAVGVAPYSCRETRVSANVYELDPVSDARWAELVQNHPGSSVFHSTNWLTVLQTTYGYDPVVVTTCAPDAPLTNGVVFCRVTSWLTGRRLVSLPFSDHCEPLVNNGRELDDLLLHMRQHVDGRKWKYAEIRPISHLPSDLTGFSRSVTYYFHRLDLRRGAQELFRNFHKDCVQRKIRRAEREALRYEEGTSEDLLQKFYQLLVMTRRRQYLPPQPLNWFRSLITAFGKDLKIRIASKDGSPVASILTLSHKQSMVYKYGCSDAAFNRLGGMAFLFWRAIQAAKDDGFEELEMGRSDVDNMGLIAFKERWGATRMPISYWTYPGQGARFPSAWQKKLARHVVDRVPDLALETVGKLLYKHIG